MFAMSKRVAAPSGFSVTIQEVAQAAGVSIGTVSRSLLPQGGVAAATRAQIIQVAQTLGYDTGNLWASKLRRVSFVLHRQHVGLSANPFYSHVLHGVDDECRAQGPTRHFSSQDQGDNVAEVVRWHGTDGLLCVGNFEPELLGQLRALELPWCWWIILLQRCPASTLAGRMLARS